MALLSYTSDLTENLQRIGNFSIRKILGATHLSVLDSDDIASTDRDKREIIVALPCGGFKQCAIRMPFPQLP